MVNAYIFWPSSGSVPSGWTEIGSGNRNRLILLGGTALSTGGAATHTHTGTPSNVSTYDATVGISSRTTSGEGLLTTDPHTHGAGSVSSVGSSSNFPSYRTVRVIYRSTTGWTGSIPAGGMVMRTATPTGWTAFTQTEFVYISATYNSTGGGTHSHSASGSLGYYDGSNRLPDTDDNTGTADPHNHSWSDTFSSSYDYYYASVGFIKANADTYVVQDSYLLFDGDPGADWTAVTTYDGRYLKFGSGGWGTGGSYSSTNHTHSKTVTTGTATCAYDGTGAAYVRPPCNHTHTLTVNLGSATAEPSYVRLLLYKANKTFWQTNTSSITVSTRVLKTIGETFDLNSCVQTTFDEGVDITSRIQAVLESDVAINAPVQTSFDSELGIVAGVASRNTTDFTITALVASRGIEFEIDTVVKAVFDSGFGVSAPIQTTLEGTFDLTARSVFARLIDVELLVRAQKAFSNSLYVGSLFSRTPYKPVKWPITADHSTPTPTIGQVGQTETYPRPSEPGGTPTEFPPLDRAGTRIDADEVDWPSVESSIKRPISEFPWGEDRSPTQPDQNEAYVRPSEPGLPPTEFPTPDLGGTQKDVEKADWPERPTTRYPIKQDYMEE